MPEELNYKKTIAQNLIYYRKSSGLTQTQLAEKINYSDKSVSKWERAEGVPDVLVLIQLAKIYEVSVNDLVSADHPNQPIAPPRKSRHILINIMSVLLVWLVATVVFVTLRIACPEFLSVWVAYIIAIPVSAIVQIVFSELWWNLIVRFVSVSSLIWSIALCIQVVFNAFGGNIENIELVYVCAAVVQLLAVVWYVYLHFRKKK